MSRLAHSLNPLFMHTVTGFYFFNRGEKKHVVYSTLYNSGRFASMHDCSGLTDEQARGKFIIEHSKEVDRLLALKQKETKLILS